MSKFSTASPPPAHRWLVPSRTAAVQARCILRVSTASISRSASRARTARSSSTTVSPSTGLCPRPGRGGRRRSLPPLRSPNGRLRSGGDRNGELAEPVQGDPEPCRAVPRSTILEHVDGPGGNRVPRRIRRGTGAPAGRGQVRSGAPRKPARLSAELAAVAGGPLQVVAEDLVELDQVRACSASQSANRSWSSARVAFGSASYAASRISRCRKRKARRPAASRRRADELLAHEARSAARGSRLVRRERLHRAAVEDLALDRAALEADRSAAR